MKKESKLFKYKFTVFTPCYNSEKTLHRVFDSLMAQTIDHKEFEWLVINDASIDNTHELILEYIKKADFDINYINLEQNQMIIKNYMIALRNANGEYFLPSGHDDGFDPETLEIFLSTWNDIEKISKNIFSICCLCKDQFGNDIGEDFPSAYQLVSESTATFKWKKEKIGETWGVQKTDLMKEFFTIKDSIIEKVKYIPESFFWNKMALEMEKYYGEIYTYPINMRLRIYFKDINIKEHLSYNIRTKYPLGFEYEAQYFINRYFFFLLRNNYKMYFKYMLKYILFGSYNHKSFFILFRNIHGRINKCIFLILYIPARIIKNSFFKVSNACAKQS